MRTSPGSPVIPPTKPAHLNGRGYHDHRARRNRASIQIEPTKPPAPSGSACPMRPPTKGGTAPLFRLGSRGRAVHVLSAPDLLDRAVDKDLVLFHDVEDVPAPVGEKAHATWLTLNPEPHNDPAERRHDQLSDR